MTQFSVKVQSVRVDKDMIRHDNHYVLHYLSICSLLYSCLNSKRLMSVSHGFRLTNFFVCSTCTFFFFHKYKPFYKCEQCEYCIVYRNCRLMNDDSMSPYFWHVTSERRHGGHRYLMMKRKLLFLWSDVCGQQNSVFQQHTLDAIFY